MGLKQSFFHKLTSSGSKNKNPQHKHTPGTGDSPSNTIQDPTYASFIQSFDALNVSDFHPYQADARFVGGFKPQPTSHNAASRQPKSSISGPSQQMSIPMPTPQHSLTMQIALGLHEPDTHSPHFPQPWSPSTQVATPSIVSSDSVVSAYSTASNESDELIAPKAPRNSQSASSQCSGVTKAGKRCTRLVKRGTALGDMMKNDDQGPNLERFCFQHMKELLHPTGYYSRKTGDWVKFNEWIPGYLRPETQVALRVEMEKPHSRSDVTGYIYTFEIRESKADSKSSTIVKLKVGRAVNLIKRIDQWGKQCGSAEQVLRGWYPGRVESSETDDPSLLKGRVQAGSKGPWCHRLERLVHLELADLSVTAVYLEPRWPHHTPRNQSAGDLKGGKAGGTTIERIPCVDCGAVHREIFEFKKFPGNRMKGQEWELLVKPVIERWGKFVETHV